MKKVLSIALIILLVGALFVSCGKKEEAAKVTPEAPKATVPAATPVTPAPAAVTPAAEKAVFRISNGAEPESLDPHQIQGVPEHRIYETIFEGLIIYDPVTADGIPGLAESWTVSDDGYQYTFKLRDAVWSDGVKITAQTVVDSWLRGLDPATASPYAWFPAMFLKGAEEYNEGLAGKEVVGIRALDEKTFQMDLVGPLPYAIGALSHYAFAVVPLHAIKEFGDKWTLPENFVG
ncbi:MAG: ABC transporter substrate-binding protein, partial [Sphaerochaetaceae bacterium]